VELSLVCQEPLGLEHLRVVKQLGIVVPGTEIVIELERKNKWVYKCSYVLRRVEGK
jgi:hypothetical protein